MAADLRLRELLLQGADQGPEGELLLQGPSIGRKALGVQAAFVGNADAFLVITPGMGSRPVQGAGAPDIAVLADIEMITYALHSLCPVAAEKVLLGEVGLDTGGGAMHHNQGDGTVYPAHADMPKAPAIPDATAMMILKMISHVLFFC